jgi:hypothetical protein
MTAHFIMDYTSFTIQQLNDMAQARSPAFGFSVRKLRKKSDIVARFQQYDDIQKREEERKRQKEALEEAHRATRFEGPPRQQANVEESISELEYPYSFLRNGEYDCTVNPIPGQPEEDVGAFPDNVAHYYWIHPGENDEEPWLTLCRLTNDVYVFYMGECDYTGFDCQGHMKLYASKDPNILLKYAMTSEEYDKYVKETSEHEN